jgi:hypothetical protein
MVLTTKELIGVFILMLGASFIAAWTYDKVPSISKIHKKIKNDTE